MRANRKEIWAYRLHGVIQSAKEWAYTWAGLALLCLIVMAIGGVLELLGKVL